MDRGTESARLVRVIATLLGVVGTALACGGLATLMWLRGTSAIPDTASVLLGGGAVAVSIGIVQVVGGACLAKWARRHRAFERARRREAMHSRGRQEKADVPIWALRTPHAQRVEDPTETTDTWALLDAMRAELATDNDERHDRHSA